MSVNAATHDGSEGPTDHIELLIPLRSEFAATARTLAASLGADAGFSVDELDDVRLAISEVVSVLVDQHDHVDGRARVSFSVSPGRLDIEIGRVDVTPGRIELDDLAENILRSVTDTYAVSASGVTLVKCALENSASTAT